MLNRTLRLIDEVEVAGCGCTDRESRTASPTLQSMRTHPIGLDFREVLRERGSLRANQARRRTRRSCTPDYAGQQEQRRGDPPGNY
jgi:hypothetical protein